MGLKNAILDLEPTSYWPLDDAPTASAVRDERSRHDGALPASGVTLGSVPFGTSFAPLFDGEVGSLILIPDDDRYSHTFANALTVACWICPQSLDFAHTDGSVDHYVHFLNKAVSSANDVEWAFRLYNACGGRPSRLSFYMFKAGPSPGKGPGSYMEFGHSCNDPNAVRVGEWLFLVGMGEPWTSYDRTDAGTRYYKQNVRAAPTPPDRYRCDQRDDHWNIRPFNGPGQIAIGGSIGKTAFHGGIAHVTLWNQLLRDDQVALIWEAGRAELGL